jgi:hypothetical protein
MSKPLFFLHLRLRLCHRLRLCFTAFISQIHLHLRHRLRLCFTAFISQICLRLLKMKRFSSNKELLFIFNSDFSDAEAARGALEITSVGADVGGFRTVPTPAEVEAGRGVSNSVRVGAQPYLYYLLNRKINEMMRMQTRNVLTTTKKKQQHQSMEMK